MTERVRVTSGGYVGIGTTIPGEVLEVNGNILLSGTSLRRIKVGESTGAGGRNFKIEGSDAKSGLTNQNGGILQIYTGRSIGTGTAGIHFFASPTGPSGSAYNTLTERMTIEGDGDVGIGTTNPTSRLHVYEVESETSGSIYPGIRSDVIVNDAPTADRHLYGNYKVIQNNAPSGSLNNLYAQYNRINNNSGGVHNNAFVQYNLYLNNDAGSNAFLGIANYNVTQNNAAGTIANSRGAQNQSLNNSTGTITNAYGAYDIVINESSGGITNGYGAYSLVRNDEGTLVNARGVNSYIYNNVAGGTITNAYGFFSSINEVAGTISNAYGLYATFTGGIGNTWGVYVSNEDKNYFSGNVGIGVSPNAKLHLKGDNQKLMLENTTTDDPGRFAIQWKNNSVSVLAGDDNADQIFGFYSGFNGTRTNDAKLRIFGSEGGAFSNYTQITHDGTYGTITTGSGDINVTSKSGFVGIDNVSPTSNLHVGGSVAMPITSKTTSYTALDSDFTILLSPSSNNTLSLPTAVGKTGRIYLLKKMTASFTVTVDPAGTETIDGSPTIPMTSAYTIRILQSDGSNWVIIGN